MTEMVATILRKSTLTLALTKDIGNGYTLVGCFGFNGPLRQYFSLYRAISQRQGERIEEEERKDR